MLNTELSFNNDSYLMQVPTWCSGSFCLRCRMPGTIMLATLWRTCEESSRMIPSFASTHFGRQLKLFRRTGSVVTGILVLDIRVWTRGFRFHCSNVVTVWCCHPLDRRWGRGDNVRMFDTLSQQSPQNWETWKKSWEHFRRWWWFRTLLLSRRDQTKAPKFEIQLQ